LAWGCVKPLPPRPKPPKLKKLMSLRPVTPGGSTINPTVEDDPSDTEQKLTTFQTVLLVLASVFVASAFSVATAGMKVTIGEKITLETRPWLKNILEAGQRARQLQQGTTKTTETTADLAAKIIAGQFIEDETLRKSFNEAYSALNGASDEFAESVAELEKWAVDINEKSRKEGGSLAERGEEETAIDYLDRYVASKKREDIDQSLKDKMNEYDEKSDTFDIYSDEVAGIIKDNEDAFQKAIKNMPQNIQLGSGEALNVLNFVKGQLGQVANIATEWTAALDSIDGDGEKHEGEGESGEGEPVSEA